LIGGETSRAEAGSDHCDTPTKPLMAATELRRLGLDAVYGTPIEGVPVVDVPPDLAYLFAEAHARLRCRPVGIHRGDGTIVDLRFKSVQPASPLDGWQPASTDVVAALQAARSPVVLAGPGVVFDGAVPGLHALAAAGSLGVLNTWGAKGVFDWRSRHHLATVGLQALDFVRGGLAAADLIISVGIDERETLADWRLAPVLDVAPRSLGPLAEVWGRPRKEITIPPLRTDIARVTQAGWDVSGPPLRPSRATRHYSLALAGGGLVAADPGKAGYWVARTFGTSGIGSVQVPADGATRGFAIACVIVARRLDPARPVLAVMDDIDEQHERLLEVAARFGISVPLEVWTPDGAKLDGAEHAKRLERLLATGGRESIATDSGQVDEMIAVAGPIVAWTST
jgi:hypothetical protein